MTSWTKTSPMSPVSCANRRWIQLFIERKSHAGWFPRLTSLKVLAPAPFHNATSWFAESGICGGLADVGPLTINARTRKTVDFCVSIKYYARPDRVKIKRVT